MFIEIQILVVKVLNIRLLPASPTDKEAGISLKPVFFGVFPNIT
jgi:hypothetical protein